MLYGITRYQSVQLNAKYLPNNKIYRANETSHRYWKLVYTAALRLRKALKLDPSIVIEFEGNINNSIAPPDYENKTTHEAILGYLFLNDKNLKI